MTIEPTFINGEFYYTVSEFSELVGRDRAQIYMLFNQGNKIRTLRGVRVGNKPMILASEVTEFPFISKDYLEESNDQQ